MICWIPCKRTSRQVAAKLRTTQDDNSKGSFAQETLCSSAKNFAKGCCVLALALIVRHLVFHLLPFRQVLLSLNLRPVHKDVLAAIGRTDETETLLFVETLHRSRRGNRPLGPLRPLCIAAAPFAALVK